MKRTLKFLGVAGLIAAFALMAMAMALPHAHNADTGQQHACWICQSKATGVSTPEISPRLVALHLISLASPAARLVFKSQASALFFQARAPPVLS